MNFKSRQGKLHSFTARLLILAMLAFGAGSLPVYAEEPPQAPNAPNMSAIQTLFPTDDIVIAEFDVTDFGATGNGTTDDTKAFQDAIDAAAAKASGSSSGGGVVFAPSGHYKIAGNLTLKTGVTLRGDWVSPEEQAGKVQGTILDAYAGRGSASGTSFIRMQQSSGLTNLSIWYPEQTLEDAAAYPWTLEQVSGDNCTIRNVTLVNSYQGIKVGPGTNELHYVTQLFGAALKTGIHVDMTSDIGRLEGIKLSPRYWAQSGLPNAPEEEALYSYMTSNAEGVVMGRSDWEYMSDILISGFKTGLRITKSASTNETANAQMYRIHVERSNVALKIEGVNYYGLLVSDSSFAADVGANPKAIYATDGFSTFAQFNTVTVGGDPQNAVVNEGTGVLSFENSVFENWNDQAGGYAIDANSGSVILGQSSFGKQDRHLRLGNYVTSVNAVNSGYAGKLQVTDESEAADIQIHQGTQDEIAPLPLVQATDIAVQPKPATDKIFNVALAPYSAKRDASADAASVIQQALNDAQAAGGGTVYLPAGNYRVSGPLTVPTGVELRGSWDVPHHTLGGGSAIFTDYGNGNASATPLISLEESSGVRGLSVYYDQQRANVNNGFKPFPWTIQGRGPHVYAIDTTLPNSYQGIDFGTYDTTGHYIDYVAGAPLVTGIYLGGGADGGIMRNVQFNPHYWARVPGGSGYSAANSDTLWTYQKNNLDAFKIGHVTGETIFNTFVFGSLYGIHFVAEGSGGPDAIVIGHGTDGSKKGVFIEGSGPSGLSFINTELVSLSTTEKVYVTIGEQFDAEARFFNSSMWGETNRAVDMSAGKLKMQQSNFLIVGTTGINVLGGRAEIYDSNFQQDTNHIYAGPNANKVVVTNNQFKGGMRLVNDANPGVVTGTNLNLVPVTVELAKNAFAPEAELKLTNVGLAHPAKGTIEWVQPLLYKNIQQPIRFEGIEPGQSLQIPLPYLTGDSMKFRVTLETEESYLTTVKLKQAFADPYSETEPDVSAFPVEINSIDQYSSAGGRWGGVSDLSLSGKLKWDDQYLYMLLDVTDDVQNNSYSGDGVWQGDGIQFRIDLSPKSGSSSPNISQIGIGRKDDGTITKWRWTAPSGQPTGNMSSSTVGITRDEPGKRTHYQIQIPFAALLASGSSFNPADPINLTIQVNDADGTGRTGYLEFNYFDVYLLNGNFADMLATSAEQAVGQAVAQITVSSIDAAKNFVALLSEGEDKSRLVERLNVVEKLQELQSAIARAETLSEHLYSQDSWEALLAAIAAAKEVSADTDFESVSAAAHTLQATLDGLVTVHDAVIEADVGGSIVKGTDGSYAAGETVDIAASAQSGYAFSRWSATDGVIFADANRSSTSFVMPNADVVITARFTYVGSGSGSSDGSGAQNRDPDTAPSDHATAGPGSIEVTTSTDSEGTARAAVTMEEVNSALDNAETDAGGVKTVTIEVKAVADATRYMLIMPAQSVASDTAGQQIKVVSPYGTIVLARNMLDAPGVSANDSIGIVVSAVDQVDLSRGAQNAVGDRPVVELRILLNGEPLEWHDRMALAKVEFDYTPAKEELAEPEFIVAGYIGEDGEFHPVFDGQYDSMTGKVVFSADRSGRYAVAYIHKTFGDVAGSWAQKSIEVLASKGIINGISEEAYGLKSDITRADFILLLTKALGLRANGAIEFADVSESDYYFEAVRIARTLGIVSGVGGNRFDPRAPITREDMMAMVARAMEAAGKLTLDSDNLPALDRFNDADALSSYARVGVEALVKNGIIEGSGTFLHPKGNTTREEMALVIYKIYNK